MVKMDNNLLELFSKKWTLSQQWNSLQTVIGWQSQQLQAEISATVDSICIELDVDLVNPSYKVWRPPEENLHQKVPKKCIKTGQWFAAKKIKTYIRLLII